MVRRMLALGTILAILLGAAEVQARSNEAIKRNNFGAELLNQGRLEEAVTEVQRAVELDPGYAAAHLNLGYLYDRLGRIEEAIAQYRKVIELEPGSLLAHNNLGVLYDKTGRYDEAIAAFDQALRIDASDATARKNLENAKKNKGIVQEREEHLSRARKEVEARPGDPRASYNLARLYAHYDDKDRAIEWLAKALALGFDEFTLLKHDPALKALRDDPRFTRFLEGR